MDTCAEYRTALENDFHVVNGEFEITLSGWELRVRNTTTGFLEAFSSMRADYEQSVMEFIGDYFLGDSDQ